MANKTIDQFSEITDVQATDLLLGVDDPSGTPATVNMEVGNALKATNTLPALTAVDKADTMLVVDDPSGTPAAKKATVEDVLQATNTLDANTAVDKADRILLVDDPTGTPSAQYATVEDILQAANTLDANTTVALTDRVAIVDDPTGTPAAQYCDLTNFFKAIGLESAYDADSDTNDVLSTGIYGAKGGFIMVVAGTDYITGLWRLDGTTLVAISANAGFSTTQDNAGTYNVYYDVDQYKVQNKVGDNKEISVKFWGIR